MNKKSLIGTVAGLALSLGLVGVASARTLPANLGTARVGSQANLFNYSFSNGSVAATGNADWALGIPGDTAGFKTVLVSGRATAAGARVRLVSNNQLGTAFAASAFQPLPVSAAFVNLPALSVNLPGSGVLLLDAIMNAGASILRADSLNP